MSWNKRRPVGIRTTITAAFTLAATVAMAITFASMALVNQSILRHGLDRKLEDVWRLLAKGIEQEGEAALAKTPPRVFAAILAPNRRTYLAQSPSMEGREMVFMKPHYGMHGESPNPRGFWFQSPETDYNGKRRVRFRVCGKFLPDGRILAVARGLGTNDRALLRALAVGGTGVAVMAGLMVLLGRFCAQRLSKPFRETVQAVEDMAAGDFSRRAPERPGSPSEVACLTRAVNAMAENTERLMGDLRAVTDNIAHDLRTPVTRLRANAELALTMDPAQALLPGEVAEACGAMMEIIEAILEIARLAHGIDVGQTAPALPADILAELTELYAPVAEERGLTLRCHAPASVGRRMVNTPLVRRALSNLIDNALKFVPAGGHVRLGLACSRTSLRLWVADDGPGVPEAMRERIFNRFDRGDPARGGHGFGLGLALVRAVAQALGGQAGFRPVPGGGSAFFLRLPALPCPDARDGAAG